MADRPVALRQDTNRKHGRREAYQTENWSMQCIKSNSWGMRGLQIYPVRRTSRATGSRQGLWEAETGTGQDGGSAKRGPEDGRGKGEEHEAAPKGRHVAEHWAGQTGNSSCLLLFASVSAHAAKIPAQPNIPASAFRGLDTGPLSLSF